MTASPNNSKKWISVASGLLLAASFFIPWVNWDGNSLSGMNLPDGTLFSTSEKLGQGNPFPQFDFAMLAFWLVPVLALITAALSIANKRSFIVAALAGVIALSQATIYYCFTDLLVNQLGYVTTPLAKTFNIGFYATIVAAIGIIIAAVPAKAWVKILLIIIGPLVTWGGFKLASDYLENKTHNSTASEKSAYTISASALIDEFKANDTLANKKYADQFVTVEQAKISEVKIASDSSATIEVKNEAGDYIIFAFEGESVKEVKPLKAGETVAIKGSCSGGGLNILDVINIEFKRSIINKQ